MAFIMIIDYTYMIQYNRMFYHDKVHNLLEQSSSMNLFVHQLLTSLLTNLFLVYLIFI